MFIYICGKVLKFLCYSIDPFTLWAYKQINVIICARINRKRHKTGTYKYLKRHVRAQNHAFGITYMSSIYVNGLDLLVQRRYFQKL